MLGRYSVSSCISISMLFFLRVWFVVLRGSYLYFLLWLLFSAFPLSVSAVLLCQYTQQTNIITTDTPN